MSERGPRQAGRLAKRLIDLAGASVAVVVLAPLLAVLALLVRIHLGKPVLFRQERPGQNGEPFTMWKFRTMRDTRGSDGELLPDAERLTGLGRVLRRMSLDELPELFNVLRGEMSLVGPRPLLMEYRPLYTGRERKRHEMKPGITGWAQVCGRNTLDWPERLALDVWYVENWSLLLDFRIMVRTFGVVLSGSGVRSAGHVTMPKFRGTTEAHQLDREAQNRTSHEDRDRSP